MGPITAFITDLEREELYSTETIPYAIEIDHSTYRELVEETKNNEYFGPYRLLVTDEQFSRIRFLYTREHL